MLLFVSLLANVFDLTTLLLLQVVSKVVLLAEEVKKGKGQWKFQGWCFWSPSSYIYTNGFTLETGRNTHGVQIKSIYIYYILVKTKTKTKKQIQMHIEWWNQNLILWVVLSSLLTIHFLKV